MKLEASPQKAEIDKLMHSYVEIKADKALPSPLAVQCANLMSLVIQTILKGQNRHLLELFQNSDDAAGEKPLVEFILIGSQLIFRHNGRPFNAEDVTKICAVAMPPTIGKAIDPEKIGYKDLGFKTLFSIAPRAVIISGGYQFRFDEAHWQEKCPPSHPVPWSIIPIWTELSELSPLVRAEVSNPKLTHFVFDLTDPSKILAELEALREKPELLIFLRKVRTVSVRTPHNPYTIVVEDDKTQETMIKRRVLINGQLKKEYLYSPVYKIPVKQAVQDKMKKLLSHECPPRIKDATEVPMQFAVPLDSKGQITPERNNLLYCYLPTQVKLSTPHITNSEVLLTGDRTGLTENVWNEFLFVEMARYHFRWLLALAKTPTYRDQIFHLVGNRTLTGADYFRQKYLQGFDINEPFIPTAYPALNDQFLALSNGIVDSIGFWRAFPELSDEERYPRKNIVRYELQGLYGKNPLYINYFHTNSIFDWQKLLRYLPKYINQSNNPQVLTRLLQYLYDCNQDSTLKTIDFLKCADGIYRKPAEVYLMDADSKLPEDLSKVAQIHLAHPEIANIINARFKDWFVKDLGVNKFSMDDFLKDNILPYLNKARQTKEQHLQSFAFLLRRLDPDSKELSTEKRSMILRSMGDIYVLNQLDRFVLVSQCMFSDAYNPVNKLDGHVNKDTQLSKLYLELLPKSPPETLRDIFRLLGVAENAYISIIPNFTYARAQRYRHLGHVAKQYFQAISSYPSLTSAVAHFVDMPILDRQKEGAPVAKIFWEKLVEGWTSLKQYRYVQYEGRPAISFLEFRLKTTPCLLYGGKLLESTKFFTPAFAEFKFLPTLPNDLPADLLDVLRPKSRMDINDVMTLLNSYDIEDKPNIGLYAKLFRTLLQLLPLPAEAEQKLVRWSGRLLAQDDTLRPARRLECFIAPSANEHAPKSEKWLKELPGFSRMDMMDLSRCFGLRVKKDMLTEKRFTGEEENPGPVNDFKRILPILALFEHDIDKGRSASTRLGELSVHLTQLTTFSVKEVRVRIEGGAEQVKRCWLNNNKLYFKGAWPSLYCTEIFEAIAGFLPLSETTKEKAKNLSHYSRDQLSQWLRAENLMETYQQLTTGTGDPSPGEIIAPASAIPLAGNPLELQLSGLQLGDAEEPTAVVLHPSASSASRPVEAVGGDSKSSASTVSRSAGATGSVSDRGSKPASTAAETITEQDHQNILPAPEGFASPEREAPFSPAFTPEEVASSGVKLSSHRTFFTPHGSVRLEATPKSALSPDGTRRTSGGSRSTTSSGRRVPVDADKIGYWGEKFVFEHLLQHYKAKYPQCDFKDTPTGFECKDGVRIKGYSVLLVASEHKFSKKDTGKNTLYLKQTGSEIRAYWLGKDGRMVSNILPKLTVGELSALPSFPKNGEEGCKITQAKNKVLVDKLFAYAGWSDFEKEIKEKLDLEVRWLNQNGESRSSADFEIIKNGRRRVIEVKASKLFTETEFFLSCNEWTTMMEYGKRYRFFRVSHVGEKAAHISKIKDPADKIRSGELIPIETSFQL